MHVWLSLQLFKQLSKLIQHCSQQIAATALFSINPDDAIANPVTRTASTNTFRSNLEISVRNIAPLLISVVSKANGQSGANAGRVKEVQTL